MKPQILFRLILALPISLAFAGPSPETHRLTPSPKTVTWGYFDPSTPPVLHIRSGDVVEVETLPAGGMAALEAAGLPRDQMQPALLEVEREVKDRGEVPHILTGPIWIEGAEPGDTLEVKLVSIEPDVPYAWSGFMPGRGFLPDDFPYAHFKLIRLDLDRRVALFANGIEIPLRPFFGVMGVAPPAATGRVGSGPPWVEAGNMDNKDLVQGTTLYIPVHVPGALFSVGDGHVGQGDGEVCVTAMETALRGSLQFYVHKDRRLRWPRAETPTHYITMGFHENLEEAAHIALEEMIDFLVQQKHLDRDTAYILASDAVDMHITQLVDGNKGAHALLPKAIFVH